MIREWNGHRAIRRRWIPAVVGSLVLLSAGSAWIGIEAVRHHNLEVATVGARNIFRMIVVTRQWNANHGGVYVPVSAAAEPNPYLRHPRREIRDEQGRQYTLVNPAYMTRQIAEIAETQGHIKVHITSLKPIRPDNRADEWESAALRSFEDGVAEQVGITRIGDREALRYMAPLRVDKACLPCHEQQGYKVGDIRGGISVSLDYAPIAQAMDQDIARVLLTHLFFAAAGAAISIAILEALRRRWKNLDDTVGNLERTRDELIRSEKMASLGRLVAGFAHEINTPVGIAVNAVSKGGEALAELEALVVRDEVSEAELMRPIEALRESQRLSLNNLRRGADLLARFKRTAVHQCESASRPFDLLETINDVLACLRGELKRTPVFVDVSCPEGIEVVGSPGLFEQMLTNVLMNSIRHGFADGTRSGRIGIDVRVDAERRRLLIELADDGVGIPEALQGRVFEPFFTTRRGNGGSGLGLFIVYNIVTRQLGGTVRCDSVPGRGTTIRIEIPHPAGNPAPETGP